MGFARSAQHRMGDDKLVIDMMDEIERERRQRLIRELRENNAAALQRDIAESALRAPVEDALTRDRRWFAERDAAGLASGSRKPRRHRLQHRKRRTGPAGKAGCARGSMTSASSF